MTPARLRTGPRRHRTFRDISRPLQGLVLCLQLWSGAAIGLGAASPVRSAPPSGLLTNVLQVRQMAAREQCVSYPVCLEGVVLWSSPGHDQLFLQDGSGGMRVQLDLRDQAAPLAGQRVRLEGNCVAGAGVVRDGLVDNDGLHGPTEKSGAIHLQAGRHPIRVEWFNGPSGFQLDVEYEGPGISFGTIPTNALFRAVTDPATGTTNLVPGLDYRCYEGSWEHLPDFQRLVPVKTGTVANFDLSVRTRNEDVALVFSGWLEVPHDGLYTFWTKSDDGSRLSVGRRPLHLSVLGSAPLPSPRRVPLDQPLPEDQDYAWTQVEGTVTGFHTYRPGELEVELSWGTNLMWLHVGDASGCPPALFSRIRATGIPCGAVLPGGPHAINRLIVPSLGQIETVKPPPESLALKPGSIAQLRQLASTGQRLLCPMLLKGVVLTTDPRRGLLALQDDSGAALIETELRGLPVQPGQSILLSGEFVLQGTRLILRTQALSDNDGLHGLTERSGAVFLEAGTHPLHLSWFTQTSPGRLYVQYQGPDLWREKLPQAALVHPEVDPLSSAVRWVPGLNFEAYEGRWLNLPDCTLLTPAKRGICPDFDSQVASRANDVALEFSGFVEVPRRGVYTFSTSSDDGSRLFIQDQPPRLEVLGTNAWTTPQRLAPRQLLRQEQESRWSEVEGTVTFVSEQAEALELELSNEADRMRVVVQDGAGSSPLLLLNSRIRATGIAQSTYTPEGYRAAGSLLVASMKEIQLLEVAPACWNDHPVVPINQLVRMSFPPTTEAIVRVRGQLLPDRPNGCLRLKDETGEVQVEPAQPLPSKAAGLVEVLGRWTQTATNVVLRCGFYRQLAETGPEETTSLPVLTTVEQVKRLSPNETQRGYPVKLRGVITALWPFGAFSIQDSTWAIFVNSRASLNTALPQVGDYWEVEGLTYGGSAPGIQPHRAVRLGPGTLPEPRRFTWEPWLNGALDWQYVEVRGVVTSVTPDGLTLFTPAAGKLQVHFPYLAPRLFQVYENALIRIRGCLLPAEQPTVHRTAPVAIQLLSPSFNVDQTAPVDLFAAPLKRVADLPPLGASPELERLKVAGQVLCEHAGEYYLQDGQHGLRFVPQTRASLNPGDQVEVVGFLKPGSLQVLEEALVRRLGHAELPVARPLATAGLSSGHYEATRVRVQARLLGMSLERPDQTLELQTGTRRFTARLDASYGYLRSLAAGSKLELVGVYAGLAADPARRHEMDYFELLLTAPTDIRVLERPPWWTLTHTLAVLGAMAVGLLAALVWITLLRRQVEQRSLQLTSEMRRHEHTRQQNALEQERTRIAKDMHDELGASVTQVSLLGDRLKSDCLQPEKIQAHAEKICDAALELGQTLDEIVWAVNPRNDTVDKLAAYLALYTEEFLQMTSIRCRIDVPSDLPLHPLSAEVRHNLFLATKEALNNAVKHAQASELGLHLQLADGSFQILIEDNGRGFAPDLAAAGNGLHNMRRRLEAIGGQFHLTSAPGKGTQLRFAIRLEPLPT